MAKIKKAAVPDNISEEYYQISEEILSSFSKYRPPVDLFRFREDIAQLYPLYRKGQRLTNEQVEEVQALCREGSLFVSRSDHPIYVEHIAKQADLVLVDANLKESEAADILLRALGMRLTAFYEQPVLACFEPLYKDVMVLTEYLAQDRFRARLFMRRLFTEDAALVPHSLNVLAVGVPRKSGRRTQAPLSGSSGPRPAVARRGHHQVAGLCVEQVHASQAGRMGKDHRPSPGRNQNDAQGQPVF